MYGASVSSHFSPPSQNRGLFMVVCRGRVGLSAESWPSDKAGSLQALTGNGARAEAQGWLARPESGSAGMGSVGVCAGIVNKRLTRENSKEG